MNDIKIEQYIDHTLLKADATHQDIERLCREAMKYHFFSVCVNSSYIALCREMLKNSDVKVVTVIGFPLGTSMTEVKAMEAKKAVEEGADEIDMVIHVGKLKDGDFSYILNDIQCVKQAIGNRVLKVIIETCLLTKKEIVDVCNIILKSGADFVKTSTGFSHSGANISDIMLIKDTVSDQLQIKASGGIRKKEDAIHFLSLGVSRIGTSNSVSMMNEI